MVKIVQNYTTKNDGYKYNGVLDPKGIMIHSTATPGVMAADFRDRFDMPGLKKSVHAFVDDAVCIQCLPWNKKAGHCLLSGNDTHLGIEMCEPKEWQTDKIYFDKVYANTMDVSVYLCELFALTEKNILSHAEGYKLGIASNHADVGHWFPLFDTDMDDFREDVRAALSAKKETVKGLQRALNASYDTKLAVDGIIGTKTTAAVTAHHLYYKSKMMKNEYVKWVQSRLVSKGHDCGETGIDGIYGKNTKTAVVVFQKENNLLQDGIVGIKTVSVLVK